MAVGIWSALRLNTEPLPPLTVHTPGHALEPAQMKQRLSVSDR